MKALAEQIAELEVEIYGRVVGVRGLMVEVAGPIHAMSVGRASSSRPARIVRYRPRWRAQPRGAGVSPGRSRRRGLARSVVVVSTSDEPALMRRQAAYLTLAIAEYFRDEHKDVLG